MHTECIARFIMDEVVGKVSACFVLSPFFYEAKARRSRALHTSRRLGLYQNPPPKNPEANEIIVYIHQRTLYVCVCVCGSVVAHNRAIRSCHATSVVSLSCNTLIPFGGASMTVLLCTGM